MRGIVITLALGACIDQTRRETREQAACAYVPLCSPLTTGAWDWRDEGACLASFTCGAADGACLDALEAMPCLSEPPTYEEQVANLRALKLVKLACQP